MAENVHSSSPNPCCAMWIKRCQKLEKSRDALRQSVKILEGQIERQTVEIGFVKKEVEKFQLQLEQQKDERIKEANIKNELEKQIIDMKAKISSLEHMKSLKTIDEDETGMLKACVSTGQEEVKGLKELLEKERRKIVSEGKKTVSEKKKATEAWNLLKDEKRKTEELKRLFEAEKKKAEDFRLCLEKFKGEANEVREKMSAKIAKSYDDAKKQIEVEKLKAYEEKKRADSERTKAEEQKMLIEEERQKVVDVKKQANHLCQKLQQEIRKREQIQKKFEGLSVTSNFGDVQKNVCKTLKAAELKLLKGKLKLERKRVKHCKRVAKQEKYEKRYVVQEVNLLKQNLIQVLYRLNVLDGIVSHNIGSTDDLQKTLSYPDMPLFKLNDLLRLKKDDFNSHTEFETPEIRYRDQFTYGEPIAECVGLPVSKGCCSRPKTGINSVLESPVGGSLRKKSQSSAVCSTSIHSSDRKLMGSQGRDSVVEISTTKSAEKAKPNLTIEKCPSEVLQIGRIKSCQVGANDIDGSSGLDGVEKPCSNLFAYEAGSQVSDNSSKKRKIEVPTKSSLSEEKLHSVIGEKVSTENDRLKNIAQFSLVNYSQVPAVFNEIDYKKISEKEGQVDLCNYDHIKNIASTYHQTEKSTLKHDDRKKAGESMNIYNRERCCIREAGLDSSKFGIEQAVNSLGNKQACLKSFENLISGGCLKLLELDNYSDELKFQNALEMPLSPTLPDIEISNFQLDGKDGSYNVMVSDNPTPLCSSYIMDLEIASDKSKLKILTDKECSNISITQNNVFQDITGDAFLADDNRLLVCGHGQGHCVQHYPAEHNKIGLEEVPVYKKSQHSPDEIGGFSEPSHSQPFHKCGHIGISTLDSLDSTSHLSSCRVKVNTALRGCQPINSDFIQDQMEVITVENHVINQKLNIEFPSDADKLNKGNSFISVEKGTGHNIGQPLEFCSMTEVTDLRSSSPTSKVKSLSKSNDETGTGRIICSFTSFSSARTVDSMSRIICAFNSVSHKNLMVSRAGSLIVEILNGLQLEDLQSEEKAAVFFSLLLGNLTERISDHCKDKMDEDSFQFLESFSLEIVRALSAGQWKYVFDQMFHLDILVCLVESFLIEREVLVIGDVKQHPSSFPDFPDHKFHMDVGNNCVLSKDATISQFIAGCIILASICVAVDDNGVLLVFSYKILRFCRDDITWVLLALHVFANIFGKRFFDQANYSFLVTTINSLVSLLEGRINLVSSPPPSCPNLTSRMLAKFSACKQCPFSKNATCMDKLLSFLLGVLEDYSLPGSDYSNTDNNIISLINGSAPTRDTKDKDSSDAKNKCDAQCHASCAIFRYRKLTANQPDNCSESVFCDYIDIISLVELVGHYMGWEWMFKEAVPRLLKMLEVCVCEEFSAALFVLVGKLASINGGSSGGNQLEGIAELRSRLTKLLDVLISRKASLPTQVAAVSAMLNLLPLKLEDYLYERQDITLDSCESPHIKQIQEWFLMFSEEQQLALKAIFDNENQPKN